MGYLYLNFLENMNQGSKSWDDFYTSSLKEQYEVIKRKVGLNINLQEFLSYAFPTQTSKNYYISMPSFDRRVKHDRRGKDVIYNIVIRPEKDSYLNNVVPNNYDLMIIGDVTFNNVIDITIKGIELIDINVAKFGEIKVNCYAATATTTKSFTTRDGRSVTVPDYGTRDLQSAVLTHDFVDRLCNDISSYPVPNPEEALNTFQNWQNYINFRKYYLGKQSERCEEIDDVIVCDSFMVSKGTYRRNEDVFSDYLLDDIADFARGEQIILSKNVNGSESFPLIRVDINKNRKTVLSETIGKSGKIYTGVCVDCACTLGICAERNAMFNMITNGEAKIKRVIAINSNGHAISPCGACREFMTQLMPNDYKDIEIMLDYENDKVVSLGDLTPNWWIE